MEDSILKFTEQFEWEPQIVNGSLKEGGYKKYILGGMGGSHLAGDILKTSKPGINLEIHNDYGVPECGVDECEDTLFIASSYSGNTEEVIDFLDESYSRGFDVLVIATGGKLIKFAEDNKIPYIQIPDTGIQPRLAIGYSIMAISSVVSPDSLEELKSMSEVLQPEFLKDDGVNLAKVLEGKTPIIYTSTKNSSIGYNWKIKINETGKTPAFCNVFPELNHNEMQGFDPDSKGSVDRPQEKYHFFLIHDSEDHLRVAKRMEILESLFQEKGYSVTRIYLEGETIFEKIFRSLLLADWLALSLSELSGAESEQVPLIEEFKKRLF
jgi:glucose/mannose-6-phosphate isomerase